MLTAHRALYSSTSVKQICICSISSNTSGRDLVGGRDRPVLHNYFCTFHRKHMLDAAAMRMQLDYYYNYFNYSGGSGVVQLQQVPLLGIDPRTTGFMRPLTSCSLNRLTDFAASRSLLQPTALLPPHWLDASEASILRRRFNPLRHSRATTTTATIITKLSYTLFSLNTTLTNAPHVGLQYYNVKLEFFHVYKF